MTGGNDSERGLKWWVRYVLVPLVGSGGVIAILLAIMDRTSVEQGNSEPNPLITDCSIDTTPAPKPEDFKITIVEPAAGASVSPDFTVSGRIENPINGYKFWLVTVDDFVTKYWPQEDIVLNGDNSFSIDDVNWPLGDKPDTATIAVLAVPKEGLELLADYFSIPKEQRPPHLSPDDLKENGCVITLETRGIVVTR